MDNRQRHEMVLFSCIVSIYISRAVRFHHYMTVPVLTDVPLTSWCVYMSYFWEHISWNTLYRLHLIFKSSHWFSGLELECCAEYVIETNRIPKLQPGISFLTKGLSFDVSADMALIAHKAQETLSMTFRVMCFTLDVKTRQDARNFTLPKQYYTGIYPIHALCATHWRLHSAWWGHDMETFSASVILCKGNPPVTSGFHWQKISTAVFAIFLDVSLTKLLNKVIYQWFGIQWLYCNGHTLFK